MTGLVDRLIDRGASDDGLAALEVAAGMERQRARMMVRPSGGAARDGRPRGPLITPTPETTGANKQSNKRRAPFVRLPEPRVALASCCHRPGAWRSSTSRGWVGLGSSRPSPPRQRAQLSLAFGRHPPAFAFAAPALLGGGGVTSRRVVQARPAPKAAYTPARHLSLARDGWPGRALPWHVADAAPELWWLDWTAGANSY